MSLRPYQEKALSRLLWARKFPDNDLVVLPQGSGKSHLIASYAKATNSPILILQPNREILVQNKSKLEAVVEPDKVAVYSASLSSRKINFFTLATIQSIYKLSEAFKHFRTVIVDECDLVSPKSQTMYRSFFTAISSPKVVGFTATPYRLATRYQRHGPHKFQVTALTVTKLINRVYPAFWNRLLFSVDIAQLVEDGYLCPLEYLDFSSLSHERIPLNRSRSDFDIQSYQSLVGDLGERIIKAVKFAQATGSAHILVFCPSIELAQSLSTRLPYSGVVTSRTSSKDRKALTQDFLSGKIKIMYNALIFTVGFDFPSLDCIVLARPTRSLRLYSQLLGRGMRPHPSKTACRVIDLSGTVKSLGKVESIRLAKDSDNKWEIYTSTGAWHNRELYRFNVK